MRVLLIALSCCCLLAGALPAGATPAYAADPTAPSTTPSPPTTSEPTTTTPATSTPPTTAPATTAPAAPPADPAPTEPADEVAVPTASQQTAARAAFVQLSDAQRALLRQLQDARDRLATTRVAALVAATDAAQATQRLQSAHAAATRAQAGVDAAARTLARLRTEIRELAGEVYQHVDRTAPLAAVDTASTIDLARAREYSMAPSDRLQARADEARAEERRVAAARDEERNLADQASRFAAEADSAVAAQRRALDDAEVANSLAVTAVTDALGSGAALLAQVADPHFGADDITAALAIAEAGQDDPATAFGLFRSPIPGAPLGSPYGMRVDPLSGSVSYHPGIDFEAGAGTPIRAAAGGVVVMAGDCGGYGNCVVVDHGHSLATVYAHQSKVLVARGDQVADGQVLGLVGSTGRSTGPHLHFEVRFHGAPVDPVPMLTS